MFKSFILFFICSAAGLTFSQEKVTWTYHYDNSTEEFVMQATILDGWHLYSQNINEDLGPVPTSIDFEENQEITFVGKTNEPESIKEFDDNFGGELNFFKNRVTFKQKMKVSNSTSVKGMITYMICSETTCLPPKDVEFEVSINK